MNELKVKIEVEKKIVMSQLRRSDAALDDKYCIIDNRFAYKDCGGLSCNDYICNIDNLMMMANSHNLQLL